MSDFDQMFTMAHNAMKNSHSPYSQFPVGICIKSKSGQLFAGTNIENSCYAECVCAEPIAIGAMVVAGEKVIDEVVIVSKSKTVATSCGGCRQKLSEFSHSDTKVSTCSEDGEILLMQTMAELLPYSFNAKTLEKR